MFTNLVSKKLFAFVVVVVAFVVAAAVLGASVQEIGDFLKWALGLYVGPTALVDTAKVLKAKAAA